MGRPDSVFFCIRCWRLSDSVWIPWVPDMASDRPLMWKTPLTIPLYVILFMLRAFIPLRLPACLLHLHLPGEVFSASAELTGDGQNAPSPGTPVPLGASPKTFWGTYLIAWRRLRRRLRKRVGMYLYIFKYIVIIRICPCESVVASRYCLARGAGFGGFDAGCQWQPAYWNWTRMIKNKWNVTTKPIPEVSELAKRRILYH